MDQSANQNALKQRIETLSESLSVIRRNMERLMAENQRLREVIRLAESELRNRRDQVEKLDGEIHRLQNNKLEARARVESAIDKLDQLMSETGKELT